MNIFKRHLLSFLFLPSDGKYLTIFQVPAEMHINGFDSKYVYIFDFTPIALIDTLVIIVHNLHSKILYIIIIYYNNLLFIIIIFYYFMYNILSSFIHDHFEH